MMENKGGIERRAHPRVARNLFMRVRIKDVPNSYWDAPLMKNISMGGCYFHSAINYMVGESLNIQIQLPGLEDPFKCTGLIRRIEPRKEGMMSYVGVGVEFEILEEDSKERLKKVIHFTMERQPDYKK